MKTIIIIAIAGMPFFMASQTAFKTSGDACNEPLAFHQTKVTANLNVNPPAKRKYASPVKLTRDLESAMKSAGQSCQVELIQTSYPYSFRIRIFSKSNIAHVKKENGGKAMLVSSIKEAAFEVQLKLTDRNGELVKLIPHLSSEADETVCFDQIKPGKYLLQFFAGANNELAGSYHLSIY